MTNAKINASNRTAYPPPVDRVCQGRAERGSNGNPPPITSSRR
jgi:hypothetical protein